MAKVIYYIMSVTDPPKPARETGNQYQAVGTFWHIRAPRSSRRTLCGQLLNKRGFVASKERPEETERQKSLCKFCDRISQGRDPVFDKTSEDGYVRPEHSGPKGTRASTRHTAFGRLVA